MDRVPALLSCEMLEKFEINAAISFFLISLVKWKAMNVLKRKI